MCTRKKTGTAACGPVSGATTDDALAVLENVEVGFYHDYENRRPKVK